MKNNIRQLTYIFFDSNYTPGRPNYRVEYKQKHTFKRFINVTNKRVYFYNAEAAFNFAGRFSGSVFTSRGRLIYKHE